MSQAEGCGGALAGSGTDKVTTDDTTDDTGEDDSYTDSVLPPGSAFTTGTLTEAPTTPAASANDTTDNGVRRTRMRFIPSPHRTWR
ncbi:hypothetical protein GCM10023318_57960 [Nocardia callitridis]|uniref:Uncharacterized protein n=1 Tax=Nocardia callitridis TaxID=648753 RepID=A0ABP9KYI6_9NOCA